MICKSEMAVKKLLRFILSILYLGFFMKVRASFCVIASAMKKAREILFRSQWHFRGSLRMPASVESGSSLYREGTGPAICSPSNISASRAQDLMRIVGRLSL